MSSMVTVAAFAAVVLPLTSQAGAVTPPQTGELLQPGSGGGTQLPTTPIPTITDQTKVEVVVPASGSPFTAGQKLNIFECADADGLADDLPTGGTACDGLTLNVGPSIIAGTGGTVDETNYEIYQLPSRGIVRKREWQSGVQCHECLRALYRPERHRLHCPLCLLAAVLRRQRPGDPHS